MNISAFRPSNILRTAENTVAAVAVLGVGAAVLAGRGVASGARRAKNAAAQTAHDIKIELAAREAAKRTAQILESQRALENMTPEQREQHRRDSAAIDARLRELLAERNTPVL